MALNLMHAVYGFTPAAGVNSKRNILEAFFYKSLQKMTEQTVQINVVCLQPGQLLLHLSGSIEIGWSQK